jgi:hypothetical protein
VKQVELMAELLKRLFHDSPKPLFNDIKELLKIIESENFEKKEKVEKIQPIIKKQLSEEEYTAFGLLLFYLHEIYANNSVNQVSSDMLSLKFSINITKCEPLDDSSKEILKFLNGMQKSSIFMKFMIKNLPSIYNITELQSILLKHETCLNDSLSKSLYVSPIRLKRHSIDSPIDTPLFEEDDIINPDFDFDQSSAKFLTIWKKDLYLLNLKEQDVCSLLLLNQKFETFLKEIIQHLTTKEKLFEKSTLRKNHTSCFIAEKSIDSVVNWNAKQNYFLKIKKDEMMLNFQFLIDLLAIENVNNSQKRISYDDEIFKFTSTVFGDSLKDEIFVKKILFNLKHFKKVHVLVNDAVFLKRFYDKAFKLVGGVEIRSRIHQFKILKNVFSGTETVDWILKNFPEHNLNRYSAIILGECFRQLRAFDSVDCDHSFKDQQIYYTMREEDQFIVKLMEVHNSKNQGGISIKI